MVRLYDHNDAWQRAKSILAANTRPDQFDKEGNLHVRGGTTGTRYLITRWGDVLTANNSIRFCCGIDAEMPDRDHQLGMALYLQHAERHFLTVANVKRGSLFSVLWLYVRAAIFHRPVTLGFMMMICAFVIPFAPVRVGLCLFILQMCFFLGTIIASYLRIRAQRR